GSKLLPCNGVYETPFRQQRKSPLLASFTTMRLAILLPLYSAALRKPASRSASLWRPPPLHAHRHTGQRSPLASHVQTRPGRARRRREPPAAVRREQRGADDGSS